MDHEVSEADLEWGVAFEGEGSNRPGSGRDGDQDLQWGAVSGSCAHICGDPAAYIGERICEDSEGQDIAKGAAGVSGIEQGILGEAFLGTRLF